MLGVQTSAVRYWEKEFDILKPGKTGRETGSSPRPMLKT
ncbi:MAG: MerR family transcriptional regulator [Bacteroidales bacterium]